MVSRAVHTPLLTHRAELGAEGSETIQQRARKPPPLARREEGAKGGGDSVITAAPEIS